MAVKQQKAIKFSKKSKVKRKGINSKKKQSSNKESKNYNKKYRGQGK